MGNKVLSKGQFASLTRKAKQNCLLRNQSRKCGEEAICKFAHLHPRPSWRNHESWFSALPHRSSRPTQPPHGFPLAPIEPLFGESLLKEESSQLYGPWLVHRAHRRLFQDHKTSGPKSQQQLKTLSLWLLLSNCPAYFG